MSDATTTAYRKVPCKHERAIRGGGIGRRETCIDGSSVLWSCDGYTYEPWPEVEAEREQLAEIAKLAEENWLIERFNRQKETSPRIEALEAELTRYRSIGTPEQIDAVVEAARQENGRIQLLPGQQFQVTGDHFALYVEELTAALTTLKGSE